MRRKIESRDEFPAEYQSLLDEYDKKISQYEQYFKAEMKNASEDFTEELNRLKTNRFQLREKLKAYQSVSEEVWPTVKDEIQNTFEKAKKELNKVSEVIS